MLVAKFLCFIKFYIQSRNFINYHPTLLQIHLHFKLFFKCDFSTFFLLGDFQLAYEWVYYGIFMHILLSLFSLPYSPLQVLPWSSCSSLPISPCPLSCFHVTYIHSLLSLPQSLLSFSRSLSQFNVVYLVPFLWPTVFLQLH